MKKVPVVAVADRAEDAARLAGPRIKAGGEA